MSTLNKSNIPIAVNAHTKLDLPFDHVTTQGFMDMMPLAYRHMLKTERTKVSLISNVRPSPMVVPTFGRIRQNLRGFFVPYRLVFPNWDAFMSDVIESNYDYSGVPVGVPWFSTETIADVFFGINNPTTYSQIVTVNDPDSDPWDFYCNQTYFLLTKQGRRAYKIFYSLGYDIVLPYYKDFHFNALALLAYAKVYLDWYANSQYLNDSFTLTLQRLLKYNDPITPLELKTVEIDSILTFIEYVIYDSNGYFEGAWDNPVSPTNGQFTSFNFTDPTSANGVTVTNNSLGSPEMQQSSNTSISIGTDFIHKALSRLSEYQHRHALSGARSIDRVLSQYGIITDNLKQQRSVYVGFKSIDINVGDIYATANGSNGNETSTVGDFAGRGFGQGPAEWEYTAEEEGIFIVISTIQPSGGYYQGYDRFNRHSTKRQFFVPEFDSLGVQIIEKGEVYVSKNDAFASNGHKYADKFGFTGRYGEYKRAISRVSGDIALTTSVMRGGDSWHLMREFKDSRFVSVDNIGHSQQFCEGRDSSLYNRIFTYTKDDRDPFFVFAHIQFTSFAPCRSLTDTFDWQDDGNKVTIDTNGAKLN